MKWKGFSVNWPTLEKERERGWEGERRGCVLVDGIEWELSNITEIWIINAICKSHCSGARLHRALMINEASIELSPPPPPLPSSPPLRPIISNTDNRLHLHFISFRLITTNPIPFDKIYFFVILFKIILFYFDINNNNAKYYYINKLFINILNKLNAYAYAYACPRSSRVVHALECAGI